MDYYAEDIVGGPGTLWHYSPEGLTKDVVLPQRRRPTFMDRAAEAAIRASYDTL